MGRVEEVAVTTHNQCACERRKVEMDDKRTAKKATIDKERREGTAGCIQ
jgi:hypothetical protein